MGRINWERVPSVAQTPHARSWLRIQSDMGLAQNTIDAYGPGLEEYLIFCDSNGVEAPAATRAQVASYVRHLRERPTHRGNPSLNSETQNGRLSNATIQQRLTVARLFYDYLIEERCRDDNPVGRGRYTPGNGFGGRRGMVRRYVKLPWIPSDLQWMELLDAMRRESLRNRLMLALAYDAALRREELCSLTIEDIDPAPRLLRIRAETTKGGQERVVPFWEASDQLYRAYLAERRSVSRRPGPLFLSESRRNLGQPIGLWTWSKALRSVAKRTGVDRFSTHTLRHLRLTDLAHAGWEIHEIATFAGHRHTDTTNDFYATCPHRMACPGCSWYVPKESMKAQLLEGKANLLRCQEELTLSEDEAAAVDEGIRLHKKLLDRLSDVPTPAGPTPRELLDPATEDVSGAAARKPLPASASRSPSPLLQIGRKPSDRSVPSVCGTRREGVPQLFAGF
ncbi:MAG: Phage integrase family protein [uncultured Rubrobacteraceae bacterium]|uniref:Phage integrase family protein n=1 Tax=uncultured Rubrobacteraceae bacterium TaxID=349277 RepID=A0A6J4QWS8_9ACTN|nr:MAG: Phage integrase family protein [uncultured Rubrobacteraceae bacterium]